METAGWRLYVWQFPVCAICLTARLHGQRKIVQRLKNDLESRSILWRILSALEFHRQSFAYRMGMRGLTGVAILLFYVLAGLIRLAWFNVSEEVRQDETEEKRKYYQGLPITSMAVLLPLLAVFKPMLGKREFMLSLHALVLLVGLLFITNFKFRKPKNRTLVIIVGVVTLAVLRMLHIW